MGAEESWGDVRGLFGSVSVGHCREVDSGDEEFGRGVLEEEVRFSFPYEGCD